MPHQGNTVGVTRHRTLLVFNLHGLLFCLDASSVRECVWLPELTPAEEAPPHIAGLFSLRGEIVPVTDLGLRFGHPARPYRLSDQVVVLELDHLPMGVIVSEVREVTDISLDAIQAPPKFDVEPGRDDPLVAGEARVGDDVVTLLHAGQLVRGPRGLAATAAEQTFPAKPFCAQASAQEHAVFRARAKALMQAAAEDDGARLPLAVVGLGGEYFGIELAAVQEFCDLAPPSPIPCCPPHILGAISLRGKLFTLLDVRAALNLPCAAWNGGKTLIARLGEQLVGVAVDAVHDVVYLREEELQAAPAALRELHGAEIRGTAAYGGKMMAVLDLPALLARREWIVNETVLPN